MFSSFRPKSSLINFPPVSTAMSPSISLRRSPKPGALTALSPLLAADEASVMISRKLFGFDIVIEDVGLFLPLVDMLLDQTPTAIIIFVFLINEDERVVFFSIQFALCGDEVRRNVTLI